MTDVLRNSGIAADIISTNAASCIIFVKVPSPDCTLLAHFENARDFHLSVYVLEMAGFAINSDVRTSTLDLVDPVPFPNSENSGNANPMRLSSITNFPSMSQPELFSQGQLQRVASSTHVDPYGNHSLRRTESVPTQNFSDFLPSTRISQPPVELNPYNYFASDRVSGASPHPDPYSRSAPVWSLNGANISESSFPWRFLSSATSERPVSTPGLHTTPYGDNEGMRSGLAVEQLDTDALSKASDFRHFMPQARRLPFAKSNTEIVKTSTKSAAKRKPRDGSGSGTQVERDRDVGPAIKKKRVTNKKTAKVRTEIKIQSQKAQQFKSRATGGRKAEPGEDTAAATKATQQIPPAKQISKTSAPRTRSLAKILPSEKTANEKHVEKRLPEQRGVATKGTTKKSEPKKQATKATPAKRLPESSKKMKPPKTGSPINNTASKTSSVD